MRTGRRYTRRRARRAWRWAGAAIVGVLVWGVAAKSPLRAQGGIRMYLFDCGTLKDRDGAPYGIPREQMAPKDLADTCALIVHPRGTLLWDTGVPESVNQPASSTGTGRGGGPRPGDRLEKTLKSQMDAIGYGPANITYLALSHAHWDHTGNVHDYLRSTWLAQKLERDAMFGGTGTAANASDYVGLKNATTRVIEGDHDVFGDGSVTLVFTPGHTPGHQSLLVRLPKTGPVILSGDLYHFAEELTLSAAPTGRNAEQTAASKARIKDLMAMTGAQLWIQHDMAQYARLKKAPQYYE